MQIFARGQLVPRSLREDEPALLLEGSWPSNNSSPLLMALDDMIDARHADIDVQASAIAASLADEYDVGRDNSAYSSALVAHLAALRLRYFGVKLLRWVRFSRDYRSLNSERSWRLHVSSDDAVYIELFHELCAAHEIAGDAEIHAKSPAPPIFREPTPALWLRWLDQRIARRSASRRDKLSLRAQRILCCGDGRLLLPLCRELQQRGGAVAWLCDRPILRLRWRLPGMPQLACRRELATLNRFPEELHVSPLRIDGIDISAPVSCWLRETRANFGARWSGWLDAMEKHFRAFRPEVLVLGEDATPFARAAAYIARRHGVPSGVVQHGAPGVRFGFAPLAADHLISWDETSKQQFVAWGIPPEQITPAGSLALDDSRARLQQSTRTKKRADRTVLLLGNVPPRDDRPDAVEFHLTSATHAEMLRGAFQVLAERGDLQVIIKPHPRDTNTSWPALCKPYPALRATVACASHWTDCLARSDVVLSCGSSAGIEAARLGWPVVQLLPYGSGDILNAERFGLLGAARDRATLRDLLDKALQQGVPREQSERNPASAASRIAQSIESIATPLPSSTRPVREELSCLRT